MSGSFRLGIAGVTFFLCLTAAARAQAAGEVTSESGLHRAIFQTPHGTIRVNFPEDLSAGDTISGTVYSEPRGKDQNQQDKNSGELAGYVLDIENQRASASNRRFRWSIPSGVVSGFATVVLRNRQGQEIGRCQLPVDPIVKPTEGGAFDLPKGSQAGSLVSVWGPFNGDSSETAVTVGGTNTPVLAESPRRIVIQTPQDAAGQTTLEVRKGGRSVQGPIWMLGLRLSATKTDLLRGETATMTAVVSGLKDLKDSPESASMIIVNRGPHIVELAGGTIQQIAITSADVRADGTFSLTRQLTGVQRGAFDITVVVTRPPSAQLPLENLTARTVERWSNVNRVTVSPEARALIVSGVAASRAQLDDLLKAQLAFRADPGSLLDALVRDYCFTLRDRKLRAAVARQRGFRSAPSMVAAFAPQQPAGAASTVAIEASDVQKFSFAQFLARLLARFTPSQPLGDLLVASQPDKQAIKIDQVTGIEFVTIRTFVVSVGNHEVQVGSCRQVVKVQSNQKTVVNCSQP